MYITIDYIISPRLPNLPKKDEIRNAFSLCEIIPNKTITNMHTTWSIIFVQASST